MWLLKDEQRIEHRLQVERRTADHLEYVSGGGLLLQQLREVTRPLACTSLNSPPATPSRAFSMAITAWSAKVWSSWT